MNSKLGTLVLRERTDINGLQFVRLLFCTFLNLGCIMLSVASTLSRSLIFYNSSTMAIGINLVILVVRFHVV